MIQQTEIYKLAPVGHTINFITDLEPTNPVLPSAFPNLLIGPNQRDDTIVLEMGQGEALINRTFFSAPILDDAFTLGRITAAQALNRIYALGGEPLLATALLGWPADRFSAETAAQIREGSRSLCTEVGVPLAGGQTIASPEPFLGFTVTGKVRLNHLKRHNTATEGCCLYLTKPLGAGILTTALQKGILAPHTTELLLDQLIQLNTFGAFLGKLPYVKALSHVSGSGLIGHLAEMAESSGLSAEIDFHKLPVFADLPDSLTPETVPDAAHQNWERFGEPSSALTDEQRMVLADPQINGGLLIAVDPRSAAEFEQVAFENKLHLKAFGHLTEKREKVIYVR